MYKLAIICGRFQPIHKGHESIINRALKEAEKVGLYIGSANNCGTEWNPMTYEERLYLIEQLYKRQICEGRLTVKPLNDRPKELYGNDQSWGKYYLECIHKDFGQPDLFVYGNDKERTQWFTERDLKGIDTLVADRHDIDISATELRKMIYLGVFDEFQKWTNPAIWSEFNFLRNIISKTKGVK